MREKIKKIQIIDKVNRIIKSNSVKKRYRRWIKEYDSKCLLNSFEDLLIEKGWSKEWYENEFKKRPIIYYLGTDEKQDKGGFLQDLSKFGEVITFMKEDGTYGQYSGLNEETRTKNALCLEMHLNELYKKNKIPSILMMQSLGGRIDIYKLKELKNKFRFKIINIGMDERLAYRLQSYNSKHEYGISGLNPVVDLMLVTVEEAVEWYLKEGIPAIYFPLASSKDFYFPIEKSKKIYDVGFIGQNYGIRSELIKKLSNEGFKVMAYGPGWENGVLDIKENNKFYNQCKIVLGSAAIGYCDDFFNPKLRDFEVTLSGRLYITHRTKEIATLFEENEEIICYENTEELVNKVKIYINDAIKREEIAIKGYQKSIKYHTYEYRFDKLFNNILSWNNINDRVY